MPKAENLSKMLTDGGEKARSGFVSSFKYEDDNRRYLDRLLKYFDGFPAAVEFRKADWYSTKVADAMKSRNVPLLFYIQVTNYSPEFHYSLPHGVLF
ncbi:MAG: hypothetical protein LBH16_09150 [Treponema sp.]|nr:hypothetical protein [Treponema sp.]